MLWLKISAIGYDVIPNTCLTAWLIVKKHLSYPDGFAGDTELLKSLARFFNSYFKPHLPVEVEHIATAPGAAFALDALLYNICEPGDGVLVPGPFWSIDPSS